MRNSKAGKQSCLQRGPGPAGYGHKLGPGPGPGCHKACVPRDVDCNMRVIGPGFLFAVESKLLAEIDSVLGRDRWGRGRGRVGGAGSGGVEGDSGLQWGQCGHPVCRQGQVSGGKSTTSLIMADDDCVKSNGLIGGTAYM